MKVQWFHGVSRWHIPFHEREKKQPLPQTGGQRVEHGRQRSVSFVAYFPEAESCSKDSNIKQ